MKRILAILMICAIALSFTACGGAQESKSAYPRDNSGYDAQEDYSPNYSGESLRNEANYTGTKTETSSQYGQKVIYNATIYLEALEFDKSHQAITDAVAQYKGYIESSNESGGDTYDGSYSYNRKSLYLIIRIPVENYEAFLSASEGFGNVTSLSSQMEDVTDSYIDITTRLSTLKKQEERLVALMNQAGSLSEMIELENALSNVRYEIESYTSRINTYDNLIAYCTVTLRLTEVSTITIADNFWQRTGKAIKNSWASFVTFLQDCFIFIIYALPYIAIGLALFFLGRKIRKAYYAKHPDKLKEKSLKRFGKREKNVTAPLVYSKEEGKDSEAENK